MVNPDFGLIARANGIEYRCVERRGELPQAVAAMKAHAGAYLLEVRVEKTRKTSSRWFRPALRSRTSGSNNNDSMEQEYIITVFSENKVGLLSQITTVFTCRNVNIESLTTSESALAGIDKFTIVVRTDPEKIEKLARQVEKRIDVLKVFVFTSDEVVQQEIALYKVTRSRNVEQLVRRHNVRILEIDDDYIVVEKTGYKSETRELFELLQPYGVQQFVRSGTVAIVKSRRELLNEYLEELARNDRKLS